jgi:hypothetical protein
MTFYEINGKQAREDPVCRMPGNRTQYPGRTG